MKITVDNFIFLVQSSKDEFVFYNMKSKPIDLIEYDINTNDYSFDEANIPITDKRNKNEDSYGLEKVSCDHNGLLKFEVILSENTLVIFSLSEGFVLKNIEASGIEFISVLTEPLKRTTSELRFLFLCENTGGVTISGYVRPDNEGIYSIIKSSGFEQSIRNKTVEILSKKRTKNVGSQKKTWKLAEPIFKDLLIDLADGKIKSNKEVYEALVEIHPEYENISDRCLPKNVNIFLPTRFNDRGLRKEFALIYNSLNDTTFKHDVFRKLTEEYLPKRRKKLESNK